MLLYIIFLNSTGVFEEMRQWLLIMLLGLGVLLTGLVVVLLVKELISGGYIRNQASEAELLPISELAVKTQSPSPSTSTTSLPAAPVQNNEAEIVAAIAGAISAHTGRPLTAFRVIRFQERV